MAEWLLILGVSFGASLLTFFSGFGLGTLLLPVFALFFPAETALLATAVVHLLNNLFKLALVHRHIDRGVLLRFGVPAVFAALVGAWLLVRLAGLGPLFSWQLGPVRGTVEPAGLVIGIVIVVFAIRELADLKRKSGWPPRWLPLGGALSGFLGGLSGHQGALRTTFLLGAGLSREAFIATGVATAVLVDFSRLSQYLSRLDTVAATVPLELVAGGTLAAFAGAWLGRRLLNKVTLAGLHLLVGVLLVIAGTAMATGVL